MAHESTNASQSLLNLLNIGHAPQTDQSKSQPSFKINTTPPENNSSNELANPSENLSASDLVAKFMTSQSKSMSQVGGDDHKSSREEESLLQPTQSTPQDVLLKLLNHSTSAKATTSDRLRTPVRSTRSSQNAEVEVKTEGGNSNPSQGNAKHQQPPQLLFSSMTTPPSGLFKASQPPSQPVQKENKLLFTYSNPFEALNASRTQSPKPPATTDIIPSPSKIAEDPTTKTPSQYVAADDEPKAIADMSARRKLTPKAPSRASSAVIRSSTGNINDTSPDLAEPTVSNTAVMPIADHTVSASEERPSLPEEQANKPKTSFVETSHIRTDGELREESNDVSDGAAHAWESVDESGPNSESRQVSVYNFPIRPFVSITIRSGPKSSVGTREDGVMEISRLKKEFDQIDRTLACATSKYISYALVRNGGIRILRQDDGKDRQVFKNSHDRIFNVSICSTEMHSPPRDHQAVLGTAVSGAVYYAPISNPGSDLFEENTLDGSSMILPPYPIGEDNNSGGLLKTRAKRSSRHPEFFAIGRGKSIHLILPGVAMSSRYGISGTSRQVDVEKLYKERALKISTGKAGKDFTFSEDDSLILSFDKAGRLRFWDIRPLLEEATPASAKPSSHTIDLPLLTFATTSPTEKSWPTSVLFVDKARPYVRNIALRYLLVGLRQNHTLQLWDIALGKAVQELNLPHETETDGVCSVNYHPNSGIIVIGHPTRNSIYFIHLSAPKHALPTMTQADFVQKVVDRDPEIQTPDVTACMSGIREMSFAEKGLLRSVDLLPIYKSSSNKTTPTQPGLFELYVLHSKGVTCLNIGKEDLGWSLENKVVKPVDAVASDYITVENFRPRNESERIAGHKTQSDLSASTPKSSKKKSAGKTAKPPGNSPSPEHTVTAMSSSQPVRKDTNDSTSANELLTRKSVHRGDETEFTETMYPGADPSRSITGSKSSTHIPLSTTKPLDPTTTYQLPLRPEGSRKVHVSMVADSGDQSNKLLAMITKDVSADFRRELSVLYDNMQKDRSLQDSVAADRHEGILRLVSSSLSNNIEKTLSRIISTQMQQAVVPAVTSSTTQAITDKMEDTIAQAVHNIVPQEISRQMPTAINNALLNPQFSRNISESIVSTIITQLDQRIAQQIQSSSQASFSFIAEAAAKAAVHDVEARLRAHTEQVEYDRRADSVKNEKMGQLLQGIAQAMQSMSQAQVAFQEQVLKQRQTTPQLVALQPAEQNEPISTARNAKLSVEQSPLDIEYNEIKRLMHQGKYEEGSVKWLQSEHTTELFDQVFVRYTPEYLATDVSSLVAFSVAVTLANALSTHTTRRLDWMEAALAAVDLEVSKSPKARTAPRQLLIR